MASLVGQEDSVARVSVRQGDYIDRTFGPGGYLSKQKVGYEPRAGQIAFAREVDRALREGAPLLAQAPCGTGKAIGYLVPAIYHAVSKHRRVLIATATNSLLDQLSKGHDCELATLQRALPVQFRYSTLKGKSNYVCRKMLEGFESDMQAEALKPAAKRLAIWADNTESGDRGEAPESDAKLFWYKISCGPDDCSKPSCIYSKKTQEGREGLEQCFADAAKDMARDSHVVVTNIHYLITHLKYDGCLPEFDYIIIDEGHELPEIAREFWGGEDRRSSFDEIVAYAYMMERSKLLEKGTGDSIRQESDNLFEYVNKLTYDPVRIALKKPQDTRRQKLLSKVDFDLTKLKSSLRACAAVAKVFLEEGQKNPGEVAGEDDAQKLKNHMLKVWEMITSIEKEDPDKARWVEVSTMPNGKEDVCIKYAPIEVGFLLRDKLFKPYPGTVLASATLSAGGNFSFIRRETGLDRELKVVDGDSERTVSAREIDVPSPFDHKNQCLFVIPKDAKDPSSEYELWMQSVFKTLRRVIELCDGRTLGLFTSRKAMDDAAHWLRGLMKNRTILVQGEYSPREIATRFKKEHESVLLGTRSFWTGLDVPGESLTAVVIDKLPVPQQEPLMVAMKNKMGGAYFDKYLFPKASITFQQGCGRVVRSVTDVGVIVLCDPRIQTKNYGHHFTKSMPAMETCDDLERIPEFLLAAKYHIQIKRGSRK